jgi:transposase-like protein
MSATNVQTQFDNPFRRNGTDPSSNPGLSVRLEEPATTSERTSRAAGGGASQAVSRQAVEPAQITKARRRRYSRDEKLRILRLADACKERGQLGALLRREGIYYSTLRDFEEQRAQGRLEAGYQKDKQAARAEASEDKKRIAQLEAQNRQLQQQLEQAQIIIDVQKKLSQLLGVSLPQTEPSIPRL